MFSAAAVFWAGSVFWARFGGGGRILGSGFSPSIWHRGRRIRPACGAALINACISGSASCFSSQELEALASYPISCPTHSNFRGSSEGFLGLRTSSEDLVRWRGGG